MLTCVSSRELTEWMAYEAYAGPLGFQYANEALAGIHELLQTANKLLGAKMKQNPIPDPKAYPRPHELREFAERHQQKEEF